MKNGTGINGDYEEKREEVEEILEELEGIKDTIEKHNQRYLSGKANRDSISKK